MTGMTPVMPTDALRPRGWRSVFGIDRTVDSGQAGDVEDPVELLQAAFAHVDLDLVPAERYSDDAWGDAVLDPRGLDVEIEVKQLALVTADVAERLVRSRQGEPRSEPALAFMVVANRVTEDARAVLLRGGWGYLDLRGHLALRFGKRVMVNTSVPATWSPAVRAEGLAGTAGLEVATALLMDPHRAFAVRELARHLGRAPSTVSAVAKALRREQLVTEDLRPEGPQLFWAVADRWPRRRTYLAQAPAAGDAGLTGPLRLGLDQVETTAGWALTDSAAAAAMGAPIVVRSDGPLDFFVPDETVARRATRLLDPTASPESARCSIRVGPVPAVCRHRLDAPTSYFEWPMAHPLFVALDLAQDKGRGREILRDWNPTTGWKRAW
jgi:hypothetical protein